MINFKYTRLAFLLCALVSCAGGKGKGMADRDCSSASTCKPIKERSNCGEEERLAILQELRDTINDTRFDKVVLRFTKWKSARERIEQAQDDNFSPIDYRIDITLNNTEKTRLMSLLRGNLQVPTSIVLVLEHKKKMDAKIGTIEYRFYKDGKLVTTLAYDRLVRSEKYKSCYLSLSDDITEEIEKLTDSLCSSHNLK